VFFTCPSPWRTQHNAEQKHHSRKAPCHESGSNKVNNSLLDVPSPSHFSPIRPFVPRELGLLTGWSPYLVSPGVLGELKFALK
jgi:hypothetical protein